MTQEYSTSATIAASGTATILNTFNRTISLILINQGAAQMTVHLDGGTTNGKIVEAGGSLRAKCIEIPSVVMINNSATDSLTYKLTMYANQSDTDIELKDPQSVVVSSGSVVISSGTVIATGKDAVGAAPTVNPVAVAGKDCSGNTQPLPICSTRPQDNSQAVFVAGKGEITRRWSFSSLILDTTTDWELLQTGTGMAISQSGGNLVITSGTTANASTVYRLKVGWTDAFIFRYICTLSARIAQNNFYYMLADKLGDGLACTVSGTTVVVTFPSAHGIEVGQSIEIDCVQNVGGGAILVPGRWAVTSADALTITFTATGSSGNGSGTCSIFGQIISLHCRAYK
jgi:hypothetical protein